MISYIVGGAVIASVLVLLVTATSGKLKLRRYFLKSAKVSEEISIVHVSDLHESRFGKEEEKLISLIGDASPDIIVITGDMVEDRGKYRGMLSEGNPARHFFEKAVKIAPCYAVFGNHERFIDDIDGLSAELDRIGVKLLHPANGEGLVTVKHGEILICGAADPYFTYDAINRRERKISQLFAEDKDTGNERIGNWRQKIEAAANGIKDEKLFTVLLSHRPEEYGLYEKIGFDAVFSGHAHGGQWRLPPLVNGVYAPHQGIFPSHAGGAYKLEKGLHVVSRGLSKKRMVRIFNRPEVCLLKITPTAKEKV